jgi:hypothetical protein
MEQLRDTVHKTGFSHNNTFAHTALSVLIFLARNHMMLVLHPLISAHLLSFHFYISPKVHTQEVNLKPAITWVKFAFIKMDCYQGITNLGITIPDLPQNL